MSAPRIDTVRNLIDSITRLLAEYRPELDDLHDMAFDRVKGAPSPRVNGGKPDYSLDRYGDMKARGLYTDIAARLVGLGRAVEKDLKEVRRHLNNEGSALSRDAHNDITAAELASALHVQQQRRQRGDGPHANFAQNTRKQHLDPNIELDHLRNAVRRMVSRIESEHRGCFDEHGKRKPKWLDRSILSPAQRDALDRALLRDPQAAQAS